MSGLEGLAILQGVGALTAANSQAQYADYAEKVGKRQQQYANRQAGQERAVAQRNAMEQRRQADLAQSRAVALAAAGGGGVSDPGVLNILGDLETEGEIRALDALYSGEQQAGALEYAGISERRAASADAYRYRAQATQTLLEGGATLWEKYRPKS